MPTNGDDALRQCADFGLERVKEMFPYSPMNGETRVLRCRPNGIVDL